MREYGKVFSQFWSSDDARSMSEDARTLALYLMTCQHGTTTGVFPLPDGYVCEDIQWSPERVSKGFDELFRKGFATRCEATKWVWIVKHLEWNRPENPNQWKSARKFAERVPDKCKWRKDFLIAFSFAETGGKAPALEPSGNSSETLSKPETETETETEGKKRNPSKPRKTRLPADLSLDDSLTQYVTTALPDADPRLLFDQFASQAKAKGWEYVDWRSAFQTYARNAKPGSGHFSAGVYPRRSSSNVPFGTVLR